MAAYIHYTTTVLLVLLVGGVLGSTDSYTAAVLEHVPVTSDPSTPMPLASAQAILKQNLDIYARFTAQAVIQGAEIIVFPEDGLYGSEFCGRDCLLPFLEYIPDPLAHNADPIVPCNNTVFSNRTALPTLSCLAIEYNITVVANMGDIQPCDNTTDSQCPSDGRYQFNSQVAFSNTGVLLNKYHKTHLFPEDLNVFNYPPTSLGNNVRSFTSHFGVKFGMFICFDIFFHEPAVVLAQEQGIQNFVFSTYWVNNGTIPTITATEMQQSFSRATHSNILASNIGLGGVVDSGSGIFSNGVPLITYFNTGTDNKAKLLLATVPIVPTSATTTSTTTTTTTTTAAATAGVRVGKDQVAAESTHPVRSIDDSTRVHVRSGRRGRTRRSVPIPPPPPRRLQGPSVRASDIGSGAAYISPSTSMSGVVTASVASGLACIVNYTFVPRSSGDNVTYALIPYDGMYFGTLLHLRICALQRCTAGASIESCTGYTVESDTAFAHLTLSANLLTNTTVRVAAGGNKGVLFAPTQLTLSNSTATTPGEEMVTATLSTHTPVLNLALFQGIPVTSPPVKNEQ